MYSILSQKELSDDQVAVALVRPETEKTPLEGHTKIIIELHASGSAHLPLFTALQERAQNYVFAEDDLSPSLVMAPQTIYCAILNGDLNYRLWHKEGKKTGAFTEKELRDKTLVDPVDLLAKLNRNRDLIRGLLIARGQAHLPQRLLTKHEKDHSPESPIERFKEILDRRKRCYLLLDFQKSGEADSDIGQERLIAFEEGGQWFDELLSGVYFVGQMRGKDRENRGQIKNAVVIVTSQVLADHMAKINDGSGQHYNPKGDKWRKKDHAFNCHTWAVTQFYAFKDKDLSESHRYELVKYGLPSALRRITPRLAIQHSLLTFVEEEVFFKALFGRIKVYMQNFLDGPPTKRCAQIIHFFVFLAVVKNFTDLLKELKVFRDKIKSKIPAVDVAQSEADKEQMKGNKLLIESFNLNRHFDPKESSSMLDFFQTQMISFKFTTNFWNGRSSLLMLAAIAGIHHATNDCVFIELLKSDWVCASDLADCKQPGFGSGRDVSLLEYLLSKNAWNLLVAFFCCPGNRWRFCEEQDEKSVSKILKGNHWTRKPLQKLCAAKGSDDTSLLGEEITAKLLSLGS